MSHVRRRLGALLFVTAAVAVTFTPAPASLAVGPTVGVADSMTVVRPTVTPTGLTSSIDLVAARGEYESVQLVITGPAQVTEVTANLGPWAEAMVYAELAYTVVDDAPGDNVPNDHTYPHGTRQPTDTEARGPGGSWAPAGDWFDALVPERDLVYGEDRYALPMAVTDGRYGAIWVDFFVPTTAAAGIHTGSIAVTSPSGTTTVPVTLEVLNWTMPATSGLPSVFMMQGPGATVCAAHACAGTAAQQRQERQLLSSLYSRMAVENRISLGNGFGLDYNQGPGALYTDAEFESRIEGPLFEGGVPYPATADFHLAGPQQTAVSSYAYSPDHCDATCATSWAGAGAGEAWANRFLWYGCDEAKPDGSGQHPTWSGCATALKRAEDAWDRRVLVTGSWQNWEGNGGTVSGHRPATATGPAMKVDVIAPYFDQVVPNNLRGNQHSTRGLYDAFLAADAGHQAWLVTACNAGACGNANWEYAPTNYTGSPGYAIDAPANQSRAMSWYIDRWDMDGEAHWAANQRLTTAWDAGGQYESGMNGDGTLFYPGNADDPKVGGLHDIPIESIRLKRIRDGREDWEYIDFLRDRGYGTQVDDIVGIGDPLGNGPGLYPTMYDATWAKDGDGSGSLLAARQRLADLVRQATTETPLPAGRIAYSTTETAGGDAEIHTVKPDGTGDLKLTDNGVYDGFPAWSPGSSQIAFSRGPQHNTANIWVMNADGSGATQLTNSPAGTRATKPAWSPDGAWLYYVRVDAAGSQVMRMAPTGGPATAVVAGYDPSIDPDGIVYYSGAFEGGQHIFAKNTAMPGAAEITYGPVDEAVDVSPDGTSITYSKTDLAYTADYTVWVRSTMPGPGNGDLVVQVDGNAYQSAFSPDNAHLVYISDDGGSQVWRVGVAGAGPTQVTAGPGIKQDPDWGIPPSTPLVTCGGRTVTVDLNKGQVPTPRADVIRGTAGADTINAGGGNDVVCGGGGDDVIQGGPGTDVLDGGAGLDTASYISATAPVTVSIATAAAQDTGTASGTDTLRAFERIYGGSAADRLTGNGGANRLLGRDGSDTLLGAGGNDALVGGAGTDTCNGGTGTDTAATCERTNTVP